MCFQRQSLRYSIIDYSNFEPGKSGLNIWRLVEFVYFYQIMSLEPPRGLCEEGGIGKMSKCNWECKKEATTKKCGCLDFFTYLLDG